YGSSRHRAPKLASVASGGSNPDGALTAQRGLDGTGPETSCGSPRRSGPLSTVASGTRSRSPLAEESEAASGSGLRRACAVVRVKTALSERSLLRNLD